MSAVKKPLHRTTPSPPKDRPSRATQTDDVPTLLAAGLLAYVAETMLHEAAGHGGVCLVQGHRITLLAPLFMRCSQVSPLLSAAGPAANILGAAIACAWLWLAPPRTALFALLIWLSFVFNALVACGYLTVGALTGFGDWASLFAWVTLPILWRLPAFLIGVVGYGACLILATVLFRRFAGGSSIAQAHLPTRAMVPAAGAAIAATLAEIAGGRAQPLPLALALGCTLGVGFSLATQATGLRHPGLAAADLGPIRRAPRLIAAAVLTAIAFVAIIGPGLAPERGPLTMIASGN
jgi:hypothetical protein